MATDYIPTEHLGHEIEKLITLSEGKRKNFERRWYNNNYFDDGYHYRFVSRTTGRIVDLSTSADTFIPYRAIPKASRQIRGITNLLLANDPVPVVYPERQQFDENELGLDPAEIAKKSGIWIRNKWQNLNMMELLSHMCILTAKQSVSYLKIWIKNNDMIMKVRDAFDVYLDGTLDSISDQPYIIETCPYSVEEIKANEDFNAEARMRLNPDNKYATSEIKEAYMVGRYGNQRASDAQATLQLKEAFIKEVVTGENEDQIKKDLGRYASKYKDGQNIIRHSFSAAGITLYDKYEDMGEYPIVDYRMEPGPMYQVPLIERFIPANKSLDSVMSRIERHIGTMAIGAWLRRRGENWQVNNLSGGQVIDYDQTPPIQAQVTGFPAEVFHFIGQLNSIIEEQGATTSALGNIPQGVKSGVAIESLKAAEYANLKIASNQLKLTVKRIAEKMLDIADKYYTKPQTVYHMENGNPNYFDVIGSDGMKKYSSLSKRIGSNVKMPKAIPLKSSYKVDIEIESGLGYTQEGKRNNMIQIITMMTQLAEGGYINREAVANVIKRFLEIFEFGNIGEFMDALRAGSPPVTQKQIQEMKVALMEVIKDLQDATGQSMVEPQPAAPDKTADSDILKIKTGFMEALKDIKDMGGQNATQ